MMRECGDMCLADPGRRTFLTALGLAVTAVVTAKDMEDPLRIDPAAVGFVDTLPPYSVGERVSGNVSLWGHGSFKHDFLGELLNVWTSQFQSYQPDVVFENWMHGTASAIGALYTGAGNLAILGEEIHPAAAVAFRRAKGYPPTGIQIATGSLDVNYFDYAHMIFVHASNPAAPDGGTTGGDLRYGAQARATQHPYVGPARADGRVARSENPTLQLEDR